MKKTSIIPCCKIINVCTTHLCEPSLTYENLDMDESLELYEEAVNLGMKASQTIENNVLVMIGLSNL